MGCLGIQGNPDQSVLGDLGQSFRYPRLLCSLWLLHSGCARTPHTLGAAAEMLPALSCGTAMSWRCSAQGSWGCLAAPPLLQPLSGSLFPGQVPSVWEIALEKGVEGGYPGLCPQRPSPKAPLPRVIFQPFPRKGWE